MPSVAKKSIAKMRTCMGGAEPSTLATICNNRVSRTLFVGIVWACDIYYKHHTLYDVGILQKRNIILMKQKISKSQIW